MNIHKNTR